MDLLEVPDMEPNHLSTSYTIVPEELFDSSIPRQPCSRELQQQRELALAESVPPGMVSHPPMFLGGFPDSIYSGPSLTQPAQSPWPSSMPVGLSILTPNLLSGQCTVDAMDTELFHLAQPIRSSPIQVGLSAPTIHPQSEQHVFNAILPQDSKTLQDPFYRNGSSPRRTTPKRRQKAATMSDKRWEPALDRIRHLFVKEGRPIKEVQESINGEFGFNATERQYKAQISKMKLERKCAIEQRKTILRHVQYRKERFGKESMHISVRGHMLTQEKIARWWKEPALANALAKFRQPSPLPTEISIRTAMQPLSSKFRRETLSGICFSDQTEASAALRILNIAQQENQVLDPRHARSLFNDIQHLLETHENPSPKTDRYGWRPSLEHDLVHIRNMMNLGSKLLISGVSSSFTPSHSKEQKQNSARRLAKRNLKFTAWDTQHGRMELSFWSARTDVDDGDRARKIDDLSSTDLARITLFTRSRTKSTACVNLDFNPLWNIPMKLTYQAMVPNNSEVFEIVDAGDVEALTKVLAMKTASLTDRDEDGRSLLSYAVGSARVDMCRFLLAHGADMNAMELDDLGFMGPVHAHSNLNDGDVVEENQQKKTQCYQIMLESGADPSLEQYTGTRWDISYQNSLGYSCYATFRLVLLLGQPFVNSNTKVAANFRSTYLKSYPLLYLAIYCRRSLSLIDVLEKAILLLRLNADITVVDKECNNILHCALMAECFEPLDYIDETQAKALMAATCDCDRCNAPFRDPKQLLVAAIAAGADIYAFNKYGNTPTMVAERYGREAEWAEALEECGIDVEQVLLHTKEWKNVLSELDIGWWHCSPERRAKIVEEFKSRLPDVGKMLQESNLTFQQFCEERDLRRKLQVDCDHLVASENYGGMVRDLGRFDESSETESQRSSEMPEDIFNNARSDGEEEFEVHQDLQLAGPTDPFTGDMGKKDNDGAIDALDKMEVPVDYENVFGAGGVHSSNRDLDIAEVSWGDDPFDLGSGYVGSPVMSFGEFMNFDGWNDRRSVMDDLRE